MEIFKQQRIIDSYLKEFNDRQQIRIPIELNGYIFRIVSDSILIEQLVSLVNKIHTVKQWDVNIDKRIISILPEKAINESDYFLLEHYIQLNISPDFKNRYIFGEPSKTITIKMK